jgi:hypothetical protein
MAPWCHPPPGGQAGDEAAPWQHGDVTGWQGWGPPQAAWSAPAEVRPGVVPLRPLGVGELLDGAITTMRRYPGPMLGLAAVFAVVTQALQMVVVYVLFRDVAALEATVAAETELLALADALAQSIGSLLATAILTWLATVVLTGLLTVVVGQAVLGRPCTVGDAWRQAAPRLVRLLGLTLLVGLVVAAPVLVVAGLLLGTVLLGGEGTALAAVGLLALVAVPVTVWLYVRLAVASPALILESSPDGPPVGVLGALRRSARLVTGAWWRTFGILLLVTVLASVISSILSVPFVGASLFLSGTDPEAVPGLGALTLQALGGVIGATVTTPFTAAVTVLLYVDRRIRREGLDIELARAAGVVIPGRMPPA